MTQPHDARYRQRWYEGSPSGVRVTDARIVIPADIKRLEVYTPCFKCEAAGGCRHRPWMLELA